MSAIVYDQASNIQLCLRILHEEKGYESINCNAHKLQLALKAGLSINTIDRLIRACSKLVGHFKHSALATGELKKRQRQMELDEKKLIQKCDTRWNSTFYMLERVHEMRWPITAVLSDENVTKPSDKYLDLTSEQWTLAHEIIKVLKPFEVATTFLCEDQSTIISSTLPVIHGLVESLKADESDSRVLAKFKETVKDEVTERWELESLDVTSSMVLSAFIDPRFKSKFLDEDQIEHIKIELVRRMDSMESEDGLLICEEEEQPKKRKKTAMDIILGEEEEVSIGELSPLDEVIQFMGEKVASRSTLPLTWWKENATKYPRLAKIARCILGIPATSATSERIFSTAGLTATKLRSCLKPSNVDALVFLNKNSKLLF